MPIICFVNFGLINASVAGDSSGLQSLLPPSLLCSIVQSLLQNQPV